LLADLDADAGPALGVLKRLAPALEHVLVVVRLPVPFFAWLSGDASSGPDPATLASIETLRRAAENLSPASRSSVQFATEINASALVDLALASDIDLIVAGSRSLRNAVVLGGVGKRLGLPVLWPGGEPRTGPIREVTCIALGHGDRASIAAFLRDYGDPSLHVAIISPEVPGEDPDVAFEVAGVDADVDVSAPSLMNAVGLSLEASTGARTLDLLVLTRVPSAVLASAPWPAPVLLLPPMTPSPPAAKGVIDVADLMDDGAPIRVRIDALRPIGSLSPVPDQEVAFVAEGRVVASPLTSSAGEVELPPGLSVHSLGVFRLGDESVVDPLAAIEEHIAIVRPTDRAFVLVDAELSPEALQRESVRAAKDGAEVLAVRMRPTRTCRSIRERLRAAGLAGRVLDARAVLDEGEALDVTERNDPVRLARVTERLQRAGFAIAGAEPPEPAEPIFGNRIEVELDNKKARRWLLDAIAESTKSVHLQVYMVSDDDVGAQVEAALAAAGARGVAVRVLVDSLHGLHGSFGVHNPLLERLAARPNVLLRTSRPIHTVPTIEDVKRRDHRKLAVIDDRIALLGGRNLAHEYYSGFEEIALSASASWREVPWLDAGARVMGPAVGALSSSFLEAWTNAGGAPFDFETPEPVGETAARVIVHRGLRDANTLDAYRELVDQARSHVYVVNGFPLALELQHALLSAIRRGVRVRSLVGHVTPTHDGEPFTGPWASMRTAATDFVHSRVDPLVEAGGEAYLFSVRDLPDWDPELGPVHPHVHAKLVSVDGERFAVGSANLDITSCYWESELMIVVDDATVALPLEAHLNELLATSTRIDRDDPKWQRLARRRSWMRHWPGVLAV
jgi:phosphatidylserine/phosphatidylglycerophosphate/cardiolipin synthase-like enzyme